jgi:hypothetical protein
MVGTCRSAHRRRISGSARTENPAVWGILPLHRRRSQLFGDLREINLKKVRVFTSQEPNSRFTIRASRVESAHGEIATSGDTVSNIEATHFDSSHRRQVSGNFRRV